jgi:hypothetical protein
MHPQNWTFDTTTAVVEFRRIGGSMRFLLIALFSLSASVAQAKTICFPENKLIIPASKEASGISKRKFLAIVDAVEAHYKPVVEARGARLQFNRLWYDGTVNSDASQVNGVWIVNSYGGLARFPGMTVDGYLQVACHEMGHHLGGAPKYPDAQWASDEGEADYFATLKCMKEMGLDSERIKAASQVLASVLAKLGGERDPSPLTPDLRVVLETDHTHPPAQCRLDTYLAGDVCQATGDLSETDPSVNTCFDYQSMIGVRPLCWFKPEFENADHGN